MRRRATGRLATALGALVLALALLALAVFARLATAPLGDAEAGARSQAFVTFLFFLAMGAYLVAAGRRWSRAPAAAAGPPAAAARRAVEPVPVPPEEAELEEGAVSACLRCGSTDMRPLTMEAGLVFGSETLAWVCHRCHWRGAPLQFESVTAYRAFVKGLHEEKRELNGGR